MAIDSLTSDLIEKITKYLDGRSFLLSASITRLWYNSIHSIAFDWKSRCLEEITKEGIISMLNHEPLLGNIDGRNPGHVFHWKKSNDVYQQVYLSEFVGWRDLYRMWYETRQISSWPYTMTFDDVEIESVRLQRPLVTFVRVTGDVVITGHNDGMVVAWYFDTPHLVQIPPAINILDMDVMDNKGIGRYWMIPMCSAGTYSPIASHDCVVTVSDSHCFVNSIIDYRSSNVSCRSKYLSVFGRTIGVVHWNHTITMLELIRWQLTRVLKVDILPIERNNICPVNYVSLESDKICCWLSSSHILKINYPCVTLGRNDSSVMRHAHEFNDRLLDDHSHRFTANVVFFFKKNVMLGQSAQGDFLMTVNGHRKTENTFMNLNARVTAATYHCNLLILGTDIGSVYVYRTERPEDLLSLKLAQFHRKFQLPKEKDQSVPMITSLSLGKHEHGPLMIVTTPYRIFTFKWLPPSFAKSHQSSSDDVSELLEGISI